MASVKITELTDIGANIAYDTLVPVVDVAGSPVTQKANLQIVGNLILDGAGGANFVAAAEAVLAQSVTNAAQPNITSVGTLSSLSVTGNITCVTGNLNSNTIMNANVVNISRSVRLAVYANNTARDIAISSPQQGMMVFNQTGNVFQGYDGTGWVNLN